MKYKIIKQERKNKNIFYTVELCRGFFLENLYISKTGGEFYNKCYASDFYSREEALDAIDKHYSIYLEIKGNKVISKTI